MTLRVIGAGLGRTGTSSLKEALETLLSGPSYHMTELFAHPEHAPGWARAARGDLDDEALLDGYVACVDWPSAAFWRPLAERHPDALILLSTRDSPETWWKSASTTIFANLREPVDAWHAAHPGQREWREMWDALMAETFTADYLERERAIAAYEAHNAAVRAQAPAARLLEWQPGDGWAPICAALDLPVPDAAFPVRNTTEDWRSAGRIPAG